MVLLNELYAELKKELLLLSESGLDETWWADSMECYCYLRSIQDLFRLMGKHLTNGIWRTIYRTSDSVRSSGGIPSYFFERPIKTLSIW